MNNFDDVSPNGEISVNDKPFWAIGENEKERHRWLVTEVRKLENDLKPRIEEYRRNLALYRGVQYATQEFGTGNRDRVSYRSEPMRKITSNLLWDFTEGAIARHVKYKPAVAILPMDDSSWDNRVSATMTKRWVDHIWYQNRFEGDIMPKSLRSSKIGGESYCFVTWDKDAGPDHPDNPQDGKQVQAVDERGNKMVDDYGKPVYLEEGIKIGDISYDLESVANVLVPFELDWKNVDYIFRRKKKHIEILRNEFPNKASEIKPNTQDYWYDYTSMKMERLANEVVEYEFFHRATKFLKKGFYARFTVDSYLVGDRLPYDHGKLPVVRLKDLETPDDDRGRSFFDNVKGLCGVYNNILNLVVRNQILASHPKWVVPAGSIDIESLGNDITIVQYKGPQAPMLVQSQPTPPELFTFMDKLKQEGQQITGQFGVSRGEPPPGIEAGIALQFLNEQENERHNASSLAVNEFIRQVAIMSIDTAKQYYDESDGRKIRFMAQNEQWMTDVFDPKHLQLEYEVRIQNSSAFSSSKTARLNTLVWLRKEFPGKISDDEVLDMLDLAQTDKYQSIATMAVKTAEAENEMIRNSKECPEPEEYEDHITHWNVHSRLFQEYGFKTKAPQEQKDALKDHLLATEMLMFDKAAKNPMFAQKLMTLELFPMFFEKPAEPAPEMPAAPEMPPMPPAEGGSGMMMPEQDLTNNPDIGALPASPEMPPVVEQTGQETGLPTME